MKKKLLILFCFLISLSSYSQITLASISGTESLIGFRVGYKINDNFEAGIKYHPSINLLASEGSAGFRGTYAKFNFSEVTGKINYVPYLIANFGQIKPPKTSSYDEITFRPPYVETIYIDYKPIVGWSLGGGIEYGNNNLKYFAEFGIGTMPNIIKSIGSTDPYSPAVINADTKKAFTTPYYISAGLVYNFE